ncbi:radical SAM family heme chaperone HemW [Sulfurospirillum sp. 1612]|uniref:radical SAM family heme chaperone HemW n=1 Tax=Sulfurospirillum sp. 1612 TaxID=3094835 RepID=UPI002F95C944
MLIYLHIPFCDSLCHYCAFNSYVDKFNLKPSYMNAIQTHLKDELARFEPKPKSIRSLFIGGGTPSTITPKYYEGFFELLRPYLCDDAEITTEANPNSATLPWLQEMRALGVNRVSFGVQSFDDEKLKFLGRNHNKNLAIKAVNHAHQAGFENISIDLIYGTSMDTSALLSHDLDIAFSLPINHLSAYSLTIEEGTPFFQTPQVAHDCLPLATTFVQDIIKRGLPQYEISNFGTYESVHNRGYWEHDDYIGIGAGAVGYHDKHRFYTEKGIEAFIKNPKSITEEPLNSEDIHVEKIFLGLRSKVGIAMEEFHHDELQYVTILLEEHKLKADQGRVYNLDYFLSDELALFITQ